MVDSAKNKDNFSNSEKADAFLIQTLETKFKGQKFKVIHDKKYYHLNSENRGTGLETLIEDQEGNIAHAGIDPKGESNLSTDYLSSYYLPKVAKPIEEILNQFDFVQNYAIELDDWDESDDWTDLKWSNQEFFEHTQRKYQISVFLPENQDKQTYLEQIIKVYDSIYDNQDVPFDLEFIPINQFYYGIPKDYKTSTYYGYYISHQMNNHVSNFSKDSKEMIENDIKLDQKDTYNIMGFNDYGIIWKSVPEKKSEN